MRRLLLSALLSLGLFAPAHAAPNVAPCTQSAQIASECDPVNSTNPLPVTANSPQDPALPSGATLVLGVGTGSTGAVTGTLAAASGKTTYICGVIVSAIGGTAAVGPITITGLTGSTTMTLQLAATASGSFINQEFRPCIPGNATNTAIVTTTTADGTASGVDVNSWGYQK